MLCIKFEITSTDNKCKAFKNKYKVSTKMWVTLSLGSSFSITFY